MLRIGYTGGGEPRVVQNVLQTTGVACYEYPGGHGQYPSKVFLDMFKEMHEQRNCRFSIHASYYMSMTNPKLRGKNVNNLKCTAEAINGSGIDRIIVHMGNRYEPDRKAGLVEALYQFQQVQRILSDYDVKICVETTGKCNQIGSLQEVLLLCKEIDTLIPCIDIGHVNSRTHGGCDAFTQENWLQVLSYAEKLLGEKRSHSMHFHVSRQVYNNAGEIRHTTFNDEEWGPNWEPFILALEKFGSEDMRVICESAGTQLDDAITMIQALNK